MLETLLANNPTSGESSWAQDNQPILWFFGTVLVAIISVIGSKVTAKSQEKKTQIETDSPSWSAFMDNVKDFYDKQNEVLTSRIASLENDVHAIKEELKATKDELITTNKELSETKKKYHRAINHISMVHATYPELEKKIPIPTDIKIDVT